MPDLFDPDLDLDQTVYGTLLTATQGRVEALKLLNIDSDRVVIREFAWDHDLTPPFIVVAPWNETINWQEGTNEGHDVTYLALVSIVKAGGAKTTNVGLGYQLQWREKIFRACHNQNVGSWSALDLTDDLAVHHVLRTFVVPAGPTFYETAKQKGFDAQAWIVGFAVRMKRLVDADLSD